MHYSALSGDARHLLRVLPSLLRGRPHHCATPQNGFFSHNVREVRLELRTDFMLDGELFVPKNGAHSIELCDGGKVSFLKC